MSAEKSKKERLTNELKKNVALLTQAGVLIGMLAGAVYWVNDKFEIADKFADMVADRASARVVASMDPLTRDEFYRYQDSLALGYNAMALELMDRLEDRMNTQDSLLYVVADYGDVLDRVDLGVRLNRLELDTLRVGVDHSRQAVVDAVVEQYRDDSVQTYINKLQAEYRFNKLMEAIRKKNREVLDEIRGGERKHGGTIFKKRRRGSNNFKFPGRY